MGYLLNRFLLTLAKPSIPRPKRSIVASSGMGLFGLQNVTERYRTIAQERTNKEGFLGVNRDALPKIPKTSYNGL